MTLVSSRRTFLLSAVVCLAACRRAAAQERCAQCGMVVDPKSPFRVEVTRDGIAQPYDTPRCALTSLRTGAAGGSVRVQEFYSRTPVDANAVRFVAGSDVDGPMGAELVPVAPDKVDKFVRDHRGPRTYRLDELTLDVLKKEGAP